MRFFKYFLLILTLTACSSNNPNNTLVVGTISGPESDLMEVAAKVAKEKYNLNLKIVEFTDYNIPNEALSDGSIDVNVFQHEPYLKNAMKMRGYKFSIAGKTFIYPMAIYSKKYQNLNEIADNALIGIPNDSTNEARALILLQKAGIITLKSTDNPSVKDIASNPKHLRIKEINASLIPRILDDLDLAAMNTNYAMLVNLNPISNGLFTEDKNSPYANIVVMQQNSVKISQIEKLIAALHSKEVKDKAYELFGNAAIAAW